MDKAKLTSRNNTDGRSFRKQTNGSQLLSIVNLSNRKLILVGLCIVALLLAAQKEPLEGVHWDAPIYLYQAKGFAETHYLINYIRHADEIADQIDGHWPAGESYSESYWRFGRLGHIDILGTIVGFLGSTYQSIVTATWLYNFLFIVGDNTHFLIERANWEQG
jgi:hypothetical protein